MDIIKLPCTKNAERSGAHEGISASDKTRLLDIDGNY